MWAKFLLQKTYFPQYEIELKLDGQLRGKQPTYEKLIHGIKFDVGTRNNVKLEFSTFDVKICNF